MVRDRPLECAWLQVAGLTPQQLEQYPPCDNDGLVNLRSNIINGWEALPAEEVCSFIDGRPGPVLTDDVSFVPLETGVKLYSINVQCLRGPRLKKGPRRKRKEGVVIERQDEAEAPWTAADKRAAVSCGWITRGQAMAGWHLSVGKLS